MIKKTPDFENALPYDIIFVPLARWDGPYSSTAYCLAKALSKYTRVFYLDNPVTYKHYLSNRKADWIKKRHKALWRGENIFTECDEAYPNLIAVTPRLILPINWMKEGVFYNRLSEYNDEIVSEAINKTIQTFNIRRFILINSFNPLVGNKLHLDLQPALKIYQTVDDISESSYVNKHGPRLEQEMMKRSDITLATSSALTEKSRQFSKDVFLIPNAADVSVFQRAVHDELPIPKEIKALPKDRKIITYIGNICHRIDYDLLVKTALHHHDKILLMVGPTLNDSYHKFKLDELPNVIFTGRKNIQDLPAYLQYSHCCIIPFLCNRLTKSIYPLKINEYLSAGKPVVSTNFSEDILSFHEVIYTSESTERFIENIDMALLQDSEDKLRQRVLFSASNNWESRAEMLVRIVEEKIGDQENKVDKKAASYASMQ